MEAMAAETVSDPAPLRLGEPAPAVPPEPPPWAFPLTHPTVPKVLENSAVNHKASSAPCIPLFAFYVTPKDQLEGREEKIFA